MFYKNNISKKRKILIISIIAIPLLIWAVLVVRINLAYPDKEIIECGYGESMDYKPDIEGRIKADVSLSPVSCVMMDKEGLLSQYGDTYNGIISDDRYNMKYLIFEISIKNNGADTVKIRMLTSFFMYASPFNAGSNVLNYMDGQVEELAAGETVNVKFSAIIYDGDVLPNSSERFKTYDIYMIVSQYPVERRLVFEIDK